jgi:putative N6-adenine-specific DNA methylase
MAEHFFITCPRGLEPFLAEELTTLGAHHLATTEGGVQCQADDLNFIYQANLHSRLASRVLWKLDSGHYSSEKDLYNSAYYARWERLFHVDKTIKVAVTGIQSPLQSLNFATLKIKDAICDRFRVNYAKRPSVETTWPDVRIHAFLEKQQFTFYLDTSGEALFKRGWRTETQEAPVRENLAAGILKISGWTPGTPLFDPFCGSGTFLIEAAHQALKRPPGLERSFAFEHLLFFKREQWSALKEAAHEEYRTTCEKARSLESPILFLGSDHHEDTINKARHNAESAGVAEFVRFEVKDVNHYEAAPFSSGIWLSNPPYGVRLSDQKTLEMLYPRLGDLLKQHFANWKAYFFSGDQRLPKLIRLAPTKRTPLFNGALECRLYEFVIQEGRPTRKQLLEGTEAQKPAANVEKS